ncbi:hypothetical protein R3P38DRAFT_2801760 [Favolaschia claudopus]|uniref:Uncharacterized protein n=1 Tax=Favolaschia claudopus TaxID=2862362 RepID=A0AAV9ZVP7_9AGAR
MALKRALIGRYHRRLELARRSLWEWIVVPNWCLKRAGSRRWLNTGAGTRGTGGHRSFLWVGDKGSGARRCEAGADRVEAHAARAARQLRHEHSGLGSSLHRTIEIHGRADACLPPLKHFPVSVTGVGSGGWLSRRVVRKLVGTIDVKKLGAEGRARRTTRASRGRGDLDRIRANVDNDKTMLWPPRRRGIRREARLSSGRNEKVMADDRGKLCGHGNGIRTNVDDGVDAVDMAKRCWGGGIDEAVSVKQGWLGGCRWRSYGRRCGSERDEGVGGNLQERREEKLRKAATFGLHWSIRVTRNQENKELLYIEGPAYNKTTNRRGEFVIEFLKHPKYYIQTEVSDELRGLRRVENAFAVEKHVEVINAAGGRAVSPANRMAFGVTSRYLPSTRRVKMCKYGSSQSGGVEEIERTLRWEGDNDADTDCDEDGNEGDFKKVASDIARTCRTWWIARDSDGARRWFMGMGEGFVMADPDAAGYAQIEQTGMIDVGDVGAVGVGSEVVGDEGEDQASEFNGEWDEDGGEQRGSGRGWDWVECKCRWRRVMAGRMERHMMDRSPRQQATVVAGKRDAKFGSSWSCIELEDGLSKVEAGKGDANRENRMSECRHRHEERHAADGAWTAGKGEMVGGIGGESGKVTSGFLGARGGG